MFFLHKKTVPGNLKEKEPALGAKLRIRRGGKEQKDTALKKKHPGEDYYKKKLVKILLANCNLLAEMDTAGFDYS